MGWWLIDTDTLASSRFVLSPLAETLAWIQTLEAGTPGHPGERGALLTHRRAYRDLLADDPVTAALIRIGLGGAWNATFMTPTPGGCGEPDFAEEVARIRRTPAEVAYEHLAESRHGPLPTRLRTGDPGPRVAAVVEWVWHHAVAPYWPARRRVLAADVVSRTHAVSTRGWAAVFNDIRPGTRWLGQGRLQINTRAYPPRRASGALVFVPVTPRRGWVSWETDRFALVYPCAGVLAEPAGHPATEALGRLLGPARAAVLVLLAEPRSTTQLVALTGQGLGSVGRHLRVLLDARLVGRGRAGRSVLYHRTALGEALVADGSQTPTSTAGPRSR